MFAVNLDPAREGAFAALAIPLLDPLVGAHRVVDSLEVLAGFVLFPTDLLAAVEVQVALVAVPVTYINNHHLVQALHNNTCVV